MEKTFGFNESTTSYYKIYKKKEIFGFLVDIKILKLQLSTMK